MSKAERNQLAKIADTISRITGDIAMGRMFEDLKQGLAEVEAYLSGESVGFKVTVPANIDVKTIRKGLDMTQAGFSDTFGFSLDAIKHWEGGRRTPEAPSRAYLTVIARNPEAVIAALKSSTATQVRNAPRERKPSAKSRQPGAG